MNKRRMLRVFLAVLLLLAAAAAVLAAGFAAKLVYDNITDGIYRVEEQVGKIEKRVAAIEKTTSTLTSHYLFDYAWVETSPLIAHAGGGIGESVYTNTPEAFAANYALGHRVFELDFDLTGDDCLVSSHSEGKWRSLTGAGADVPYTGENVLASSIAGLYRTMDYKEAIDLLSTYPDVYLITDTKYYDSTSVFLQFSQLVRYAMNTAPEVLDRIIPQIHQEEMLDWVMAVYPFRSVIFTLYRAKWTPDSLVDFCGRSGVGFITMPCASFTPEIAAKLKPYGIRIGVHTTSSKEDADTFYQNGVDMIYTDFLTPDLFP